MRYFLLSLLVLLIPAAAHASVVVGQSNTTSLSQGLVGYWTLDGSKTNWLTGTTQDSSGLGNTGQLIGMSTTTSPTQGKVGQGLKFNGSSTYISTPTQNLPDRSQSVRGLYSSNFSQNGMIVEKDPVNTQWELRFESGGLRWLPASGTGVVAASPSNNHWHHIVATQTGTTASLYVDGVLVNTATVAAIGNGSGPIYIGRYNSGYYFNGSIDDVRIYNRALSAQEVQQLYKLGGGTIAQSNPVTLSTGLVGYWPFDGSDTNWSTGITKDISGNGNNGTLVACPPAARR